MNRPSHFSSLSRARWIAPGLIAAGLLAACHTTPPTNSALQEAHRALTQASANPEVVQYATPELDRARMSLARADQAWQERRDPVEVEHLAYLAQQSTQVAINTAVQHAADTMVTSAGSQRERMQTEVAQAQAQSAQANAASANSRADVLEQQLSELSAKHTNRGLVVVLQDVLFDTGQAELRAGALNKLQQLAEVLKAHPERRVLVEGFTDSTGSHELNETLSQRRAESVRDALVNLGVPSDHFEVRGYGESKPVASNKTAAGRQQNRRVEIVFSDAQGQFARQPS